MFKNVARTTDKENTHGGPHGDADDFPDEEVDAVDAACAEVVAGFAGAHGVLTAGEDFFSMGQASRCVFWTWRSADNCCLRGEKRACQDEYFLVHREADLCHRHRHG